MYQAGKARALGVSPIKHEVAFRVHANHMTSPESANAGGWPEVYSPLDASLLHIHLPHMFSEEIVDRLKVLRVWPQSDFAPEPVERREFA